MGGRDRIVDGALLALALDTCAHLAVILLDFVELDERLRRRPALFQALQHASMAVRVTHATVCPCSAIRDADHVEALFERFDLLRDGDVAVLYGRYAAHLR